MDDYFLTFMRLLQIHDYYEPSPSTPDSRLAATLQRQELDYALDTQRRQQGFLRPRAFETHFSNFNSAQRPLPNEESFARRRYSPSSSLSRTEPRNLGDDWLPDEIDMGLHDELEPLWSRAHDPSADVEIFAQEPPSPLIDVSEQECTACTEKFGIFDRLAAPCGHWFCRECLQTIFTKSFDSEGLFPPQCCRQQPIPLDDTVRSLLTPEIVADYARKKLEFGTLDRDRLYCHWCSIFLVPVTTHVKHQWRCMNCKATTCSACKGKGHLGQCPPNAEDQKVFDLAKKNGWKACYNCHRIVSLGEGCNHMQCKCGAEWCYLCRKKWRTCNCPMYNRGVEDNIFRAMDVQEMQLLPPPPQQDNGRRFGLIFGAINGQARQRLQRPPPALPQRAGTMHERHQNEHCRHRGHWNFVPFEHHCVWCGDRSVYRIQQCPECGTQGCIECLDSVRTYSLG